MTPANAKANAAVETAHGSEALDAARCLAENGFFRDAISRAYYAAYHWARALLMTRGIEPKTHRGTIQLFHLHFVKDGPLSESDAAHLSHLETYRELSDYTSTAEFTEQQARDEIGRAAQFIAACTPHL